MTQWDDALGVATAYRRGTAYLAGEAAHRFAPPGAGVDTCIGDAVDLGWKLAAAINGWVGPALRWSGGKPVTAGLPAPGLRRSAWRTAISSSTGSARSSPWWTSPGTQPAHRWWPRRGRAVRLGRPARAGPPRPARRLSYERHPVQLGRGDRAPAPSSERRRSGIARPLSVSDPGCSAATISRRAVG